MPRCLKIRRPARPRGGRLATGVITLLGAALVVGGVLAAPDPAAAGAGVGAATTPVTTRSPCPAATYENLRTAWQAGEVVMSDDFTYDRHEFTPPAGVTVGLTDRLAASGTQSLLASGLTADATLQGSLYADGTTGWLTVSLKVRLAGAAPAAYVTLRPSPRSGLAVSGTARVTADGWATLTAFFVPGLSSDPCGPPHNESVSYQLTVLPRSCAIDDPPLDLAFDDLLVATTYSHATGDPSPTPPAASTSPLPPITCGPPPTTTTTTPAQPVCAVTQTVQSQWQGGYVASLQVRNVSSTPRSTWTLRWTFPADQRLTSLWGAASWTQTGAAVTAVGPSWAPIPPNGSVTVGFLAQGAPGPLGAVTVDGVPCTTTPPQ